VSGDIFIWLAASRLEAPLQLPQLQLTWVALIWLGLLGSCLAYLLYYYLLSTIGPTRSTMVTYLFPVIAVVLGVIFLQEQLDWRLLAGGGLVLIGIVIVNRTPGRQAAKLEVSEAS
jgi:drug/metabolite transporter (DMT)-like permease